MTYEIVTTDDQLSTLCQRLAAMPAIGLDTEFVSEYSYQPHLCLIQVAAGQVRAVIDPLAVGSLTPFWTMLIEPQREIIVHAGYQELRFILQAVGAFPNNWFDVQLAAGMVGMDYPLSYSKLVAALLKQSLGKGETRTDWRQRPLTSSQLRYAMDDVLHLEPLHERLTKRLNELGRMAWFRGDTLAWQQEVQAADIAKPWWRVPGATGLSVKAQAIAQQIWLWRDAEAQRRNRSPRQVLRDDLLVEIARRESSNVDQLLEVRGLEQRRVRDLLPQIAQCVKDAPSQPSPPLTSRARDVPSPKVHLLAQFLSPALAIVARSHNIAPVLLGTSQDIKDFVAYRLAGANRQRDMEQPALAQGWRAEIVGKVLDQLLAGDRSLRIAAMQSEQPLAIE